MGGEEEEDLFVFNDTIEGPRAPAVKPGRMDRTCPKITPLVTRIQLQSTHNLKDFCEAMCRSTSTPDCAHHAQSRYPVGAGYNRVTFSFTRLHHRQ